MKGPWNKLPTTFGSMPRSPVSETLRIASGAYRVLIIQGLNHPTSRNSTTSMISDAHKRLGL